MAFSSLIYTVISMVSITSAPNSKNTNTITCDKSICDFGICNSNSCKNKIYICTSKSTSCNLRCDFGCQSITLITHSQNTQLICSQPNACNDISISVPQINSQFTLGCHSDRACSSINIECANPNNCQCQDHDGQCINEVYFGNPWSTTTTSLPPTIKPTQNPTKIPTQSPSVNPTQSPSNFPSEMSTKQPSQYPTQIPSKFPTQKPSDMPTENTSQTPTQIPSQLPTVNPTLNPIENTIATTQFPTGIPSELPTTNPTENPIENIIPTVNPSHMSTVNPSHIPTHFLAINPSQLPTENPPKSGQVLAEISTESPLYIASKDEIITAHKSESTESVLPFILIIVLCVVFIGICIAIAIYIRLYKKQKFRNDKFDSKIDIEMVCTQPDDGDIWANPLYKTKRTDANDETVIPSDSDEESYEMDNTSCRPIADTTIGIHAGELTLPQSMVFASIVNDLPNSPNSYDEGLFIGSIGSPTCDGIGSILYEPGFTVTPGGYFAE